MSKDDRAGLISSPLQGSSPIENSDSYAGGLALHGFHATVAKIATNSSRDQNRSFLGFFWIVVDHSLH